MYLPFGYWVIVGWMERSPLCLTVSGSRARRCPIVEPFPPDERRVIWAELGASVNGLYHFLPQFIILFFVSIGFIFFWYVFLGVFLCVRRAVRFSPRISSLRIPASETLDRNVTGNPEIIRSGFLLQTVAPPVDVLFDASFTAPPPTVALPIFSPKPRLHLSSSPCGNSNGRGSV